MIEFAFNLSNPFSRREWSSLFCKCKSLTKNKVAEVQVSRSNVLFNTTLRWSMNSDHAGINLQLGIISYEIEMQIYDSRHWDYQNRCWKIYD